MTFQQHTKRLYKTPLDTLLILCNIGDTDCLVLTNYERNYMKYQIRDGQNRNRIVGTYSSRVRASNKKDKLDNEYGAYRFYIVPVGNAGQSLTPNN